MSLVFRVFKTASLEGLSDDQLAAQFTQTGDPARFGEIYARHGNVIFRACLAMVRDSDVAVDLAHDCFLRAYQRMGDYRGGSLRAWLLTIARNHCLNYLSRAARRHRSLSELVESAEPAAGPLREPEDRHLVESMLARASADQQVCLKLFYYTGYSYEEIAGLTGLTLGEVKSCIQNGLGRIRRAHARAGT